MNKTHLALALGVTLLAGCASLPPLFLPAAHVVADGRAELRVQTLIAGSPYAAQGLVSPYGASDVHHVVLSLYKLQGNAELAVTDANAQALTKEIAGAALGQPVSFSKLKNGTTYRIKAAAYLSEGDTELISVPGGSSYVDVAVTDDDRPTLTSLKVKLIDRAFGGQATASGITVTPGSLAASGSTGLAFLAGVTTLAGAYPTKTSGLLDGTGTAARFYNPAGIALDASGNLFIADRWNHTIRKLTPAGVVTTLAGNGSSGSANGTGTSATFNNPSGIAIDASGNLYVVGFNHAIRKVTPAGVVTTFTGSGMFGFVDGTGTAAKFESPSGIAIDASGSLYVADSVNHAIRKVTPEGIVTTLAGSYPTKASGFLDGTGTAARFNNPSGIAVDAAGNLFVADTDNHAIRKVTPAGVVTTLAGAYPTATWGFADGTGTAARFYGPKGITIDAAGTLYVADVWNSAIRKVTPAGVVTTLTGSYPTRASGLLDGSLSTARFANPSGIAIAPSGILYVGDTANHAIRMVNP